MKTLKISILALVLAVAACDRTPLNLDNRPVSAQPDAAAPDAFVAKTDVAPIATDTLVVVADAFVRADAQVIPDLPPAKSDAFAVDTAPVKYDALVVADTAPAKSDAGTPDTIIVKLDALATPDVYLAKTDTQPSPDLTPVKTDASAPDTTPVKTDVQPPVDTFIVKTDTQPSPDLTPVKTDTQPTGLTVLYPAANPAGYTMYNGTEKVNLLAVEVKGNGNVSTMTFKHHGSASSDWGNFYLFDNNTLLMSASIDPVTEEIVFPRLLLSFADRTTQLYLTGDLNTAAVGGDTHYFSLETADKVVANVPVSGAFPVVGNTFTVSGILPLNFEPSSVSPVSSMIVTANTNDNTVERMDIDGASEPVSVQCMTLFATGTNPGADIVSLRVFDQASSMICSGALDTNGQLTCINNSGLFTIDGKTTITLKVNVDQVYPAGSPYRAASGDQFKVGITMSKNVSGRAGCFRAIGTKTGMPYTQRDLASGFATSWSLAGPEMTIRKSQPTVATIAGPQTLMNGESSFYKYSVTAASNGDVGLKRVAPTVFVADIGSIGDARFLVNGTQYDAVSIAVPGGTWGVDLKTSTITNPVGSMGVVFTADNEFTISAGTTKTFEFRAMTGGVHAGSTISTFIDADPFDSTTGTIAQHEHNTFLWSDWSADVHSTESADWIGGALVKSFPTTAQYIGQ